MGDPGVAERVRDPDAPICEQAPAAAIQHVDPAMQAAVSASDDMGARAMFEAAQQEALALQTQLQAAQQEAEQQRARIRQLEAEKGVLNGVAPAPVSATGGGDAAAELQRQLDAANQEMQRLRDAGPGGAPSNDALRQELDQAQKELQELREEKARVQAEYKEKGSAACILQ